MLIQTLLCFVSPLLAQEESESPAVNAAAAAGGGFGGILGLVIGVIMIVALWKIFSKAGKPGWAAIVPIYNYIVWCQVVGRPAWWVILLLFCFPVFYIILCIDLAKSFGKSGGYAIGLILLPFIFFPMLGFGSATYQGPSAAPKA
jgi:hypothetical protein